MLFVIFTDRQPIFIGLFPLFIISIEFLEFRLSEYFRDVFVCFRAKKMYKFNNSSLFPTIDTIYILLYILTVCFNSDMLVKYLLLFSILLIFKQVWFLYIRKLLRLL